MVPARWIPCTVSSSSPSSLAISAASAATRFWWPAVYGSRASTVAAIAATASSRFWRSCTRYLCFSRAASFRSVMSRPNASAPMIRPSSFRSATKRMLWVRSLAGGARDVHLQLVGLTRPDHLLAASLDRSRTPEQAASSAGVSAETRARSRSPRSVQVRD